MLSFPQKSSPRQSARRAATLARMKWFTCSNPSRSTRSLVKGAPPLGTPPRNALRVLEGLIRYPDALQEVGADLNEVCPLDGHLDGEHPVCEASQTV